jgi:hypothetical protein
MSKSEEHEEKAISAKLINALKIAFTSEDKYILLLRSFKSRLVSKKTYRLRVVEREETRLVRGEIVPTGRKIKDYEHGQEREDDVRSFLLSAANGVHVIIIDGDVKSLSISPFSILSLNSEWRSVFEELKCRAQLIAVVPEASKSLLEEIQRIKDMDELDRCVFLMPPSQAVNHGSELVGMTRRERWTESRVALPVDLPQYDEKGAVLIFSKTGSLVSASPYNKQVLAQLLLNRSTEGAPLAHALAVLDDKGLLSHTLTELRNRSERLHAA